MNRAFHDLVVLGIGGHDIKLDFRHAPHRALADIFFLHRKTLGRVLELRLQHFHHFVHDGVGDEEAHLVGEG